MIKKYLSLWFRMTIMATQTVFISRFGVIIFFIAKVLRFLFFFVFIFLLEARTKTIAGYTLWQMLFFYATFNVIDLTAQFFLREVYRFRSYVVHGAFDYILVKPMSALFRSLFGGSDIIDFGILIAAIWFLIYSAGHLGSPTVANIILYVLLIGNAFLISLSYHIFTISVGILTTEVDSTIMLFRDLNLMGRVPIDIYKEPIKGFLTFAVPVGIMITFPAKALMGLLSVQLIFVSFFVGILFFFLSLKFWSFALKRYVSASS